MSEWVGGGSAAMDNSRVCVAWMPALADGIMYKNNLIVVVSAHQELADLRMVYGVQYAVGLCLGFYY